MAAIYAWHANEALVKPTIAEFNVHILEHIGDGFHAELSSTTEVR